MADGGLIASIAIARVGRIVRWRMWAMPIVEAELHRPGSTVHSLSWVCIRVGMEPHIVLKKKRDIEIKDYNP